MTFNIRQIKNRTVEILLAQFFYKSELFNFYFCIVYLD